MGKIIPERTCKYGHGLLVPVVDGEGNHKNFASNEYSVKTNLVNPNSGYIFTVYQCPACTYIEFGDET